MARPLVATPGVRLQRGTRLMFTLELGEPGTVGVGFQPGVTDGAETRCSFGRIEMFACIRPLRTIRAEFWSRI